MFSKKKKHYSWQEFQNNLGEAQLPNDLGFGTRMTNPNQRMLNKDGSFNVARVGVNGGRFNNIFYSIITLSWWKFFLVIIGYYAIINVFFGFLYMLGGDHTLNSFEGKGLMERLINASFFSVQTMTTVGYGVIYPQTHYGNIIASIEALVGFMSISLLSGLLYGKFSKPEGNILFSTHALIAPYRNGKALMFRIVNPRHNQLIDVNVSAYISLIHYFNDTEERKFTEIALERTYINFFPTNWTIVHPIDENSPLLHKDLDDLQKGNFELLILIRGIDDTYSQPVHARSSYKVSELVWGAKFVPMTENLTNGLVSLDINKLSKYTKVEF